MRQKKTHSSAANDGPKPVKRRGKCLLLNWYCPNQSNSRKQVFDDSETLSIPSLKRAWCSKCHRMLTLKKWCSKCHRRRPLKKVVLQMSYTPVLEKNSGLEMCVGVGMKSRSKICSVGNRGAGLQCKPSCAANVAMGENLSSMEGGIAMEAIKDLTDAGQRV